MDGFWKSSFPWCSRRNRPYGQTVHHPAELLLNKMERAVLAAIEQRPTSIDQIIATSGFTAAQVLSTLSVLEMLAARP